MIEDVPAPARHRAKSFCRMCISSCGMTLEVENGRIAGIVADRSHPLSAGYACFKGLQVPAAHNSDRRVLHPLRRTAAGTFETVGIETAFDEIAARIAEVVERHGSRAVAFYAGSPSFYNTGLIPVMRSLAQGLGASYYSSTTIDQPGKMITADRMGAWSAGKPELDDSDVVLLVGTNPLISGQALGTLTADPVKKLRKARARGLKLVVIDPRRSETAHFADVLLQLKPGEDVTVLAGFIRETLATGRDDKAFCAAHVAPGHTAALRAAVEPFAPDYVEARAGVPAATLREAVALFTTPGLRGAACSGTGPAMGPHSSLAEHLVEVINVICGRYNRAGDPVRRIAPWLPSYPPVAQVRPPSRHWEHQKPSSRGRVAALFGERLTCSLADEILTPGEDNIRVLITASGNLATNVPDQRKMTAALRELDMLVTIDPFMTNTARLSHYVLGPKLQYERPDLPFSYGVTMHPLPWAQYTPAVVAPPEGSEVVDEAYVFWSLAKRLGIALTLNGHPLDMQEPPNPERLVELFCRGSIVPFDEIKAHPDGGAIFPLQGTVQPADGRAGKFETAPADVCQEISQVLAQDWHEPATCLRTQRPLAYRLAVRRIRDLLNSQGLFLPEVRKRCPDNRAALHPDDMASLGITDGQKVLVGSLHGEIAVRAAADPTVRPGVVTIAHSWGGLPEESNGEMGANVNLLLSTDEQIDPFTAIATMTGVPVYVVADAGERRTAEAKTKHAIEG